MNMQRLKSVQMKAVSHRLEPLGTAHTSNQVPNVGAEWRGKERWLKGLLEVKAAQGGRLPGGKQMRVQVSGLCGSEDAPNKRPEVSKEVRLDRKPKLAHQWNTAVSL